MVDLESKHRDLVFRSSRIPTFHITYTYKELDKGIQTIKNSWLSEPFYASLMGPSLHSVCGEKTVVQEIEIVYDREETSHKYNSRSQCVKKDSK